MRVVGKLRHERKRTGVHDVSVSASEALPQTICSVLEGAFLSYFSLAKCVAPIDSFSGSSWYDALAALAKNSECFDSVHRQFDIEHRDHILDIFTESCRYFHRVLRESRAFTDGIDSIESSRCLRCSFSSLDILQTLDYKEILMLSKAL